MRTFLMTAAALFIFGPLAIAQQTLSNDSVIKLVKAGLSDDLVVSTIKATPGTYNTSADSLIALKTAGASDKVISAIVLKASSPALTAQTLPPASPTVAGPNESGQPIQSSVLTAQEQVQPASAKMDSKPRVFLESASKGPNRNAERDQSMEMSKDLEKNCPNVRVTINQQMADYTIALNHIEVGLLVRDNQIQVANKDGDLISKTKEGGSIAAGMKKACELILADWAKK